MVLVAACTLSELISVYSSLHHEKEKKKAALLIHTTLKSNTQTHKNPVSPTHVKHEANDNFFLCGFATFKEKNVSSVILQSISSVQFTEKVCSKLYWLWIIRVSQCFISQ